MAATTLRAIIGLGNPGPEYTKTRHNAGFWFVDALADQYRASFTAEKKLHGDTARINIAGQEIRLLKPNTFMNKSGQAVQAVAAYFKIHPTEILVVHDELDLPAGTARLKKSGGHGGHNGLRDIIRHLGNDFPRLRVGIGHPGHKNQVLNYVLKPANAADQHAIEQSINNSINALDVWLNKNMEHAMQQLHSA